MIIVDFSQVVLSNILAQLGNHTNVPIELDLIRHMVLNMIRGYKVKFGRQYGEIVLATDSRRYWRKEVFPYYKANRKEGRDAIDLDWPAVFKCINTLTDELREFFPYRVINVDGCEADDIIGTLCHTYGRPLGGEPILILSADKDFVQLQEYGNVTQYDPIHKKAVKTHNAEAYLAEHIIRGDRGDGIPNCLSPDNSFVTKTRQKKIYDAKVEIWVKQQPEDFLDEVGLRGWKRNKQLVDLSQTPLEYKQAVIAEYKAQEGKGREKLFNYFIHHKLRNLIEALAEF